MTLHQLRIFAAVTRHLNITKASEELHISQPSVSQQLKLLEEEYEVKLYKKIGRGIELTENGRLLVSDAESILLQLEELKEKFGNNLNNKKVGSLTVGGSHAPSASLLPLLLAVFKDTHPQVHLTLRTDKSRALELLVLNHEVELAVITNPSYSPDLVVEPCRKDKLVIFGPPTHPLANGPKVVLAEVVRYPFVIKKGREGVDHVGDILRQLEKRGFKVNVVLFCDSPDAVKTAVRHGAGLGILYHDLVQPEIKAGNVKVIKVRDLHMTVNTSTIYHKNIPLSPMAQDFLTLLREWPQKMRWPKGSLRDGLVSAPGS